MMLGSTKSKNSQKTMGTKLDLKLIDETYGTNADLYEDVLRVPTTATQDEIQLAYFDRRSELFTLLAKIDAAARDPRNDNAASLASVDKKRFVAEKKMDSVVFAVRILADPALRKAYNGIRPERTGVASQSVGFTLQDTSAANGNPAIIRSFSAASETSSSKISSRSRSTKQSTDETTPRVVTPTESPIEITASASTADSRNWIQSAFSSSLFGSISNSKTEDDAEDEEDRSSRKSKRRLKKEQSASSTNRNRDADLVQELQPEGSGEKEKKSIWGRKKRKKKNQNKDENGRISLNNSMDTNATETSMTDHEDANLRNKNKFRSIENNKLSLSMKSSTSNAVDYEESPHEAVRRGSRKNIETFDEDDDTRRDDDTRTFLGDDGETFATGSLLSSQDLDEKAGACDDSTIFGCCSGSRAFKKIANEVSGACEDTLVSVDQVFNAFTLTDKDIKAVKKKIDKAKRQLDS